MTTLRHCMREDLQLRGLAPEDPTVFHRGCKASLVTLPAKGYTGLSLLTSGRVTRLLDHDLPEYDGAQQEDCGGNTTKAGGDAKGIVATAVLQGHAGSNSATSHHTPRVRFPAAASGKSLHTVGTDEAEIMPSEARHKLLEVADAHCPDAV